MTAGAPGTTFRRDRFTVSLYGAFVTWGWYLYAFTPTVPLIAREFGISFGVAGLHGTAMAAGAVTSGLLTPSVALRAGRRALALLGISLLTLGIGVLVLGPGLAATLTGSLVASVGGNMLVTAAQPALVVYHGLAGPSAVTEGNAFGSGIGLLAPLAVGGAVAIGWGWRPAVGLTVVLGAITAGLIFTLRGRSALERPAPPATPAPKGRQRYTPALWFFLVALICAIAIETSTAMWAPDLIATRAGAPASLATAAVSAMVLGMTVARFIAGPLAARKAPEKLLLVGFAIAAVGWLVLWTATTPVIAVAGILLAGFGYGTHYPLGMALVLRASAGRPDQAQGLAMLGAGIAVGITPFALGALADVFGTHRAFLIIGVLIVIGGSAVWYGLRAVRRGSPTHQVT